MFVAPLEDEACWCGWRRAPGRTGGGDAAARWPIRSGDDGDLGDPKTLPFERCLPGAEVVGERGTAARGCDDDRHVSTSAIDRSRGVAPVVLPELRSVGGCEHDTHRQEAECCCE